MRPATDLPGLTEDDAARVATAFGAARTTTTRAVYARQWRLWERWCTSRGIAPLPGDPAALCAYLAERAAIEGRDDHLLSTLAEYAAAAGAVNGRIVFQINGIDIELPLGRYLTDSH